jgi:peptidoglycan/LPS O-acetylase OafA/YrhL
MSLRGDVIYPSSQHARLHGPFHWPFIHAFTEGYQWVCLFLMLAAWVGALKPLGAMNHGNGLGALNIISKAALRRPLRLMIPAGIITVISCVMAQFDLFHYGRRATLWVVQGSPSPQPGLKSMFQLLWNSLWSSWFDASNYYEMNQWVMKWFLEGSWKLYAALLPLCMMDKTWRRVVLGIQFWWAWKTHECKFVPRLSICFTDEVEAFVNIPTYSGIVLAEISTIPRLHDYAFSDALIPRIISPFLLIFGWYLISFPGVNWEWAPWFHWIWANREFWFNDGDVYRLTCTIGVWCLLLSILLSPTLQSFLNAPLIQWLGKQSFAMYLIHGVILRSVFTFVAHGLFAREENAEVVGIRLVISLGVFIGLTLYLAALWVWYVEPWCEMLIDGIEKGLNGHFDLEILTKDLFSVHEPNSLYQKLNVERHGRLMDLEKAVESASRLD